jgi:hypothetical protein
MATSGPGIDAPGELFLGSVNTTSLVLGKMRALVINNAVSPPTVTVNGSAIPATVGNVVGPASAADTALATYSGTSGKTIQDNTGILVSSVGQMVFTTSNLLTGIVLPNLVLATDDNIFKHYQQTTMLGVLFSGPWAAQKSATLYLERVGNLVSISVDLGVSTNDGGAPALISSTGLGVPSWVLPSTSDRNGPVNVLDAGVWKNGSWSLDHITGLITLSSGADPTSTFAIGGVANSGVTNPFLISYKVN